METHYAHHEDRRCDICDQFVRIPGLFRQWELEFILSPGSDYHIEEQGQDAHGIRLLAVYRREPMTHEVTL